MLGSVFVFICYIAAALSLNNGLARTPPMGFLTWERFRCNRDCANDPDNCIGEGLLKQIAQVIVSGGYKDVGYEYVIIDDCWLDNDRAADGRLQAHATQFPSGMKALADHIHNLGLKFGIYEDYGTHTCAGYPGSKFYMQLDAQTFADWGVDYLKFDGCYHNPHELDDEYPPMSFFLNKTGRPIVMSCEYPLYQRGAGIKPNYQRLTQECNLARNFDDISDSWDSVLSIINFYGDNDGQFAEVAAPGYFNDPDEIIVGNYGLSYDQQRVQMGMWAILAAPLLVSADLRNLRQESKDLLLNSRLIAINQDKLGIQGTRVSSSGGVQIWKRPMSPSGSIAFAYIYTGDGNPVKISTSLKSLGLTSAQGYNVTEVFDGKQLGKFKPDDSVSAVVNPSGIFIATAVPLQ